MSKGSLGVYVHVPFCRTKCPYCDFYSLTNNSSLMNEYVNAVCRELGSWGEKIDKTVDTIYFGGGTPSILATDDIIKILTAVRKNFRVYSNAEITLETNPADTEFLDFERLRCSGLNRVSLGAQSLNDNQLKILGRRHNAADIKKSVNLLRRCNIDNISLDIILGVPEQTDKDIEHFVDFCVFNNIAHVSAYILKIEEGTPYYFNKDNLKFWGDDKLVDFYDSACGLLKKYEYNHYEISNFARRGFESRHNLKYWHLDDYLGVGPSAHSCVGGKRFYYEKNLKKFIYIPEVKYEPSNPEKEFVMLGLRTQEGITDKKCQEKLGYDLPKVYFERAKKFEKYGFAECSDTGIKINEKGFLVSNTIIAEII